MPGADLDLMRGTLDLLVMRAVVPKPLHGFGIVRWIRQATQDDIKVEDGALYLSLRRLEERKLVRGSWGITENNRRARYYELTASGRETLARDTATWTAYAAAVFRVLKSQREAIRLLEQLT
ncbi:MAG: PadR family transcriptional regulator [Gemmatimonadota bacterium]